MAEDTNSGSLYSLITSEKWFDDPKLQNALFEDAIENMDHGLHVRSRQSDYGGE